MSWTLTKKSDTFAGPGEMTRREVVLDPQVSPEEIKSREVELGLKLDFFCVSNCFSTAVLRTYGHCLCDCSVQQLRQQLRSTYISCCAMARGHCLNIFVVLAAVHGILGLPGWRLRSSLNALFLPLPPAVPVPNEQPRFCGR